MGAFPTTLYSSTHDLLYLKKKIINHIVLSFSPSILAGREVIWITNKQTNKNPFRQVAVNLRLEQKLFYSVLFG